MVTEELIETIREGFRNGKRRAEIKQTLMQNGVFAKDIDVAIAKIQHDAIKKLPGIAWIYQYIESLESKKNLKTPGMTLLFMAACIIFLFLLAGGFYIAFDPLDTHTKARDVWRQADQTEIQNALEAYYQKNHTYPDTLAALAPVFLTFVPHDPQTKGNYSYKVLDRGKNYLLCISFETQQIKCVKALPSSEVIPIVPTATIVPTFAPQAVSGGDNGRVSSL